MTSFEHEPAEAAAPGGGPLVGIRILEFAGVGPGPYGGMLLSDLGADVIRIDRTDSGPGERRSIFNRGKRSVAIDLRSDGASALVCSLVETADALIDPFRPGVMERLGIGPDVCRVWNPRLVYARMTGWGQTGPYAPTAGHDLGYIAVTGLLHAVGEAGGPPRIPLNIGGDFGGGGAFLAIGILAGLLEAKATGRGTVVDAAMVDGAASLLAGTFTMLNGGRWVDERGSNLLDGGAPFYSVYETRDGLYLSVAPIEPKFFREFVRISGVDVDPASQNDRAAWPAIRETIAERIRTRTQAEWVAVFDGSDACVAPVASLTAAADNDHVRARGSLIRGKGGGVQPGIAPRVGRRTALPPPLGSSPVAGQHTADILAGLGLDVQRLVENGVVSASEPDQEGLVSR